MSVEALTEIPSALMRNNSAAIAGTLLDSHNKSQNGEYMARELARVPFLAGVMMRTAVWFEAIESPPGTDPDAIKAVETQFAFGAAQMCLGIRYSLLRAMVRGGPERAKRTQASLDLLCNSSVAFNASNTFLKAFNMDKLPMIEESNAKYVGLTDVFDAIDTMAKEKFNGKYTEDPGPTTKLGATLSLGSFDAGYQALLQEQQRHELTEGWMKFVNSLPQTPMRDSH